MIPFICRAEKIDSDELVDGYYAVSGEKHLIFVLNNVDHSTFNAVKYRWWEEIKPESLEISFDGGENWRSVDEIKGALEIKDHKTKVRQEKLRGYCEGEIK